MDSTTSEQTNVETGTTSNKITAPSASNTALRGANLTGNSSQPYITLTDADSDTLSTEFSRMMRQDDPKETSILTLGDRKTRLPSGFVVNEKAMSDIIDGSFVYENVISKYSYWRVDSITLTFVPRHSPMAIGKTVVSYLQFDEIGYNSRISPRRIFEIGQLFAGTYGFIDIAKGSGCSIECKNATNKQWFSVQNKDKSSFPGIIVIRDIYKHDDHGGAIDVYISFNNLKVYLPRASISLREAQCATDIEYREKQGLEEIYNELDRQDPARRNPPTNAVYTANANSIDRSIPSPASVLYPVPHKTKDDLDFDNIMGSWPLFVPFGTFSTAKRVRFYIQEMIYNVMMQATSAGNGYVYGYHPMALLLQAFKYGRYSVKVDFHVVRNNFQTGLFKVKYMDTNFTGESAEGTVSSTYWNITSSDGVSMVAPYVDVKKYMLTSGSKQIFDFRAFEVELIGNIIPTVAGTADSVHVFALLTFFDVEMYYPRSFLFNLFQPDPPNRDNEITYREKQSKDDVLPITSTMSSTGRPNKAVTSFRQLLHLFSPTAICDPVNGLRDSFVTILDALPMLYMNMTGIIQTANNINGGTTAVYSPNPADISDEKDALGVVYGPTMVVTPRPLEISTFYCKEESEGDNWVNNCDNYNLSRCDFSYPICPIYLLIPDTNK